MKPAPSFLLGLALMGLGLSAPAQTAPKPKTQPAKSVPRTKGAAAQKRTAYGPPFIKDTAAFLRSGRPADGIQNRILPKN